MFIVIRPEDRDKYTSQLNDVLKKTAISWKCDIREVKAELENKESVYVLYAPKGHGVMGFARLTPSDILQNTWICDQVEMFDSDQGIEDIQTQLVLVRWFYEGLYECLRTFSLTHKVKAIVTDSTQEEHNDIKCFGKWPFIHEKRKIENPEGYMGALFMDDQSYLNFQKNRDQIAA